MKHYPGVCEQLTSRWEEGAASSAPTNAQKSVLFLSLNTIPVSKYYVKFCSSCPDNNASTSLSSINTVPAIPVPTSSSFIFVCCFRTLPCPTFEETRQRSQPLSCVGTDLSLLALIAHRRAVPEEVARWQSAV